LPSSKRRELTYETSIDKLGASLTELAGDSIFGELQEESSIGVVDEVDILMDNFRSVKFVVRNLLFDRLLLGLARRYMWMRKARLSCWMKIRVSVRRGRSFYIKSEVKIMGDKVCEVRSHRLPSAHGQGMGEVTRSNTE
jgi:hypothetical protein